MRLPRLIVGLLTCAASSLSAITVEVEDVLDAPDNNFGTFSTPSAAYAMNGQLLLESTLAFNLFVLEDGGWVQLIDRYRTEDYNRVQEGDRFRGDNKLYDSNVEGEMLYSAQQRPLPAEHYRVFVNDEGQLEAEWVSEEYYNAHLLRYLSRGWSMEDGLALRYGYRIDTPQSTVYTSPSARIPQIIGPDGTVVYNFMEEFPDGFVESGLSITRNPAGDRVAMVISFVPEEDSPYYRRFSPRVMMMAIFRIDYGDAATRVETEQSETSEQSESMEESVEPVSAAREAAADDRSAESREEHRASLGIIVGSIVAALIVVLAVAMIVRRRRS